MSNRLIAILAFYAILLALPSATATSFKSPEVNPPANIQTRALVDTLGEVHVLWVVPAINGSSTPAGIWYSKYSPNGTGAIPPTPITNSTTVQSADLAIDPHGNAVIVWADDIVMPSQVSSILYFLQYNLTTSQTSEILTTKGSLIMWPSVAVDNNSTSHIVWTQYAPSTERAWIEYGTVSPNKFTNTHSIVVYNQANTFPPKAKLAFDVTSGYLDVAWGESHSGVEAASTVDYAKLIANGTVLTTLQVAKLDETVRDMSVTVAPDYAGAVVVWQTDPISGPVYVEQISRAGRLVYLKQLDANAGAFLAVSEDSQNNLYIAWFQPSDLNSLFLKKPQARTPVTKVGYLSLNQAGDIVNTGNQIVRGPIIAIAASTDGDLYAVSRLGPVEIITPPHQSESQWFAAFAFLACIGVIGAISNEEGRYKLLSSFPTAAWISHDRSSSMQGEVAHLLNRNPGLSLNDIRRSTPDIRVGISDLIQMEKKGVVCSFRDGLSRRFYAREAAEGSRDSLSTRILFWILEHPGIWEAQLSKDLGLSQQIVHYHLKRLLASRLVDATFEPGGKRKLYRFTGTAGSR